jgi:F-type H+-transporting ATPase subunit delta
MSLRGASAEALRGLTDELGSALGGSADAARVSADLFGVADLLRSEPSLRRVATDVSLAASAKQGLVREILGEKVSGAAADLVADAVGRRWTSTRDLADVLEHLGVLAAVESAGSDSARLSDELFEFGQVVKDNPALRDALSDPARSREDKATMLRSLLEGRSLPATLALAEQALAGSFRTVSVALAVFQQLAADVHQQKVATVRVARPLSDDDRSRLTEALTRTYDRDIHLNVVVDPDVIGGIRVEIGDDVIDGTVSNRLDDARRKLAG